MNNELHSHRGYGLDELLRILRGQPLPLMFKGFSGDPEDEDEDEDEDFDDFDFDDDDLDFLDEEDEDLDDLDTYDDEDLA